jgi:hypothetical protein
MLWLYIDTGNVQKIADLANNILWFSIPSIAFFITLPILLKKGVEFYLSLGIAAMLTAGCYGLMLIILARYGIKL